MQTAAPLCTGPHTRVTPIPFASCSSWTRISCVPTARCVLLFAKLGNFAALTKLGPRSLHAPFRCIGLTVPPPEELFTNRDHSIVLQGCTPLHWAAIKGNAEAVYLLTQVRAAPPPRGRSPRQPLVASARSVFPLCMQALKLLSSRRTVRCQRRLLWPPAFVRPSHPPLPLCCRPRPGASRRFPRRTTPRARPRSSLRTRSTSCSPGALPFHPGAHLPLLTRASPASRLTAPTLCVNAFSPDTSQTPCGASSAKRARSPRCRSAGSASGRWRS